MLDAIQYSDPRSEVNSRKHPQWTWRFRAIFGDFQVQKSQKLTEFRCQLKEFSYMSCSIRTYMCTNICVYDTHMTSIRYSHDSFVALDLYHFKLIRVKIDLKTRAPQGPPPKNFAPPGPQKGVPPQFRTVIKKLGEKSGGAPRSPRGLKAEGMLPPIFPPTSPGRRPGEEKRRERKRKRGKRKERGKKGRRKGRGGAVFGENFGELR